MRDKITIREAYREKNKDGDRERGGNRERRFYLNTVGAGKSLHLSLIIEQKLEEP